MTRIRFALRAALAVALSLAAIETARAEIPTRNVQVLAHLDDFQGQGLGNQVYSACWSYIHSDGREYAVIGAWPGTAIYNITDPANPHAVGFISGPLSLWREMKSYRNWIYIVSEGEGSSEGVQIVRMTDPEHPVLVGEYKVGFNHSHTVSVDTTRALLICNGTRNTNQVYTGMKILSLENPEDPVELSTWPPGVFPVPIEQYVHDSVVVGTRLYASSIYSGHLRVIDLTDPTAPTEVTNWTTPGLFTHSAWPDASGRYLYVADEVTGKKFTTYDLANLAAPVITDQYTANPVAIVHNPHVRGNELYLSHYTEGIRILDLSDPAHPAEFGYADSYLDYSGGFNGVWEVCPYFPSGTVIASDRQSGLWVYRTTRNYGVVRVQVVPTAPTTGVPSPAAACHTGGASGSGCCCAPGTCSCSSCAHHAGTGTGAACGTGGCCCAGACSCASRAASGSAGFLVYLDDADSLTTQNDGVVQFAPDPRTHTIRAHNFGYFDAVASVPVSLGSRDTLVLPVQARPASSFSGTITSAATGVPLEDAEITLAYGPLHQHVPSDGRFLFPSVPDNDYLVQVRRPGYVSVEYPRHIGPGYGGQDFQLVPAAFYDPLESETGWTVGAPTDSAITGQWVRVDPIGTGFQLVTSPGGVLAPTLAAMDPNDPLAPSAIVRGPARPFHEGHEGDGAAPGSVQPESDRTPPPGTQCFVTGNGANPNNPDQQDLDGGRTTLTSPAFDVTGLAIPALAYWRWYYSSPPDPYDYLACEISGDNGQTWVPVDTTTGIQSHWAERVIHVADYVTPSSHVRLRFVAADGGDPLTIVEAAIDDVMGFDAAIPAVGLPPTGPRARLAFRAPWPNPADAAVHLTLELPSPADVSAEIVDVQGRRVRTLHRGPALAGLVRLEWDGRDERGRDAAPGLYFARARGRGEATVTRFVLAR